MTSRLRSAGRSFRIAAGFPAALAIGLAFNAAPASAWPEERGPVPLRVRHHRPVRKFVEPLPPRAAIISGYLPRNHGVPMYNEPPQFRSSGGPAR